MFDLSIRYTGFTPRMSDTTQRQWNSVKRESWDAVGHYWVEHFRAKHFTKEGEREYSYTPRSGEVGGLGSKFWRTYTGKKQRQKGHTLPLIWSGELMNLTRVTRVESTATSTRSTCRVIMPAANKANYKNKHTTIDMRDELTRVSEAEGHELADQLNRQMQAHLDEIRTVETVGFGSGI